MNILTPEKELEKKSSHMFKLLLQPWEILSPDILAFYLEKMIFFIIHYIIEAMFSHFSFPPHHFLHYVTRDLSN